ncbi:ABC transporter permease [Curtobacterium sp. MCPF17_052]|uniref:ABC transporter permease n=1 Tax=Curtobacterium sp. MCPF17_052 TaxID=2175655 RepID=UPI0024DF88DC|nr:ABC transporter permease [Curtobacterium sp. MCPF17_052]WIB11752.1 ABC transporter permease [Curtobacterium sp. MCPF17_052]
MTAGPATATRRTLGSGDLLRLGVFGLRTRPTRVVLSALGIAIGIAAMIAVVGISSSSKAALDRVLDTLGTNVLTVTKAESFGETPPAPGHRGRLGPSAGGRARRSGGRPGRRRPGVPEPVHPARRDEGHRRAGDLGETCPRSSAGRWRPGAGSTRLRTHRRRSCSERPRHTRSGSTR